MKFKTAALDPPLNLLAHISENISSSCNRVNPMKIILFLYKRKARNIVDRDDSDVVVNIVFMPARVNNP